MNFKEMSKFIRQHFIFYLSGFLIIFGIKYFYSKAGSDELKWILAPTTWWVEILSGIPFEYESGADYVNHSLRFLIAPSCSGVQFMIITIGMLIFSFAHRLPRIYWVPFCVLISYPLTVFINSLRIIVAIYLPDFLDRLGVSGGFLNPDRLHTTIGIAVYFVSLLVVYHITDYIMPDSTVCCKARSARRFLLPLFWYFSIALGVPFLNRAYRKNSGQFSEYAALIISVCAIILVLYCLIFLVRKLTKNAA